MTTDDRTTDDRQCLVLFHAHPDDEAIATGGVAAHASADGHRVVLVVATNGEHGEVPDDLARGETLVRDDAVETEASARCSASPASCGSATATPA